MKRHGFHGVGASHGAHRNHRKPGSIGGCATPGRVFKGLQMAGRMGGDTVTTQNLTVHAVDADKGVLLVKGAVPGPRAASSSSAAAAKAKGADAVTTIDVLDAAARSPAASTCPPRSSTSRSTSR